MPDRHCYTREPNRVVCRALADGEEIEVISELTAPVTVSTITRLLGVPSNQWEGNR